jgi:hypothetical protein
VCHEQLPGTVGGSLLQDEAGIGTIRRTYAYGSSTAPIRSHFTSARVSTSCTMSRACSRSPVSNVA